MYFIEKFVQCASNVKTWVQFQKLYHFILADAADM